MNILILAYFLLTFSNSAFAAPDIELLWGKRGEQAVARIREMGEQLKKSKTPDHSPEAKCEAILEKSYGLFSSEERRKLTVSKVNDDTVFKLLLREEGGGDDITEIMVIYDKGSTIPSALSTNALSKGWSILHYVTKPEVLAIHTNSCVIQIPIKDPLSGKSITAR